MKLDEYVLASKTVDLDDVEIDLEGLTETEKEKILKKAVQPKAFRDSLINDSFVSTRRRSLLLFPVDAIQPMVLKRNNKVRYWEELRLEQLAVRIQIQRLTDQRSVQDESTIKTKTGEWHKDLVRKRSRGKSIDISSALYRRISLDLIEPRRYSRSNKTTPSSTPTTSRPYLRDPHSQMGSDGSQFEEDLSEDYELTQDDFNRGMFQPSYDEAPFDSSSSSSNNKLTENNLTRNLSLEIKREEIKDRNI